MGIIPSTKEVVEFNGIHKDTDQLWDKYNRKYKNNLYDQIELYFNNETEFLEHCSAMDDFSVNEDVVILARHQLLTSKKFKYLRDNVPRIDL